MKRFSLLFAALAIAACGGNDSAPRNGAAARFVLDGVPNEISVDTPTTLTITVKDALGNTVVDYAGTVHIVLTDGAAPVVTDVRFTPSMRGTADVSVVFFT